MFKNTVGYCLCILFLLVSLLVGNSIQLSHFKKVNQTICVLENCTYEGTYINDEIIQSKISCELYNNEFYNNRDSIYLHISINVNMVINSLNNSTQECFEYKNNLYFNNPNTITNYEQQKKEIQQIFKNSVHLIDDFIIDVCVFFFIARQN